MILYCDGYSNLKSCGFIVSDLNRIVSYQSYPPNKYTSNTCEYLAMLEALELSSNFSVIYSDSQLVVNQITNNWKCNYPHLKVILEKCKSILREKDVDIFWISRNKNIAGKIIEEYETRERKRFISF